MPNPGYQNLLSTTDAAKIASCTSGYITRLCRTGKLEGVRIGKEWYVKKSDLKRYIGKLEADKEERRKELARQREAEYRTTAMLSSEKAAAILNVTPGYVTKLFREGKLEGTRVGKAWYVRAAALEAYAEEAARSEAAKKIEAEQRARNSVRAAVFALPVDASDEVETYVAAAREEAPAAFAPVFAPAPIVPEYEAIAADSEEETEEVAAYVPAFVPEAAYVVPAAIVSPYVVRRISARTYAGAFCLVLFFAGAMYVGAAGFMPKPSNGLALASASTTPAADLAASAINGSPLGTGEQTAVNVYFFFHHAGSSAIAALFGGNDSTLAVVPTQQITFPAPSDAAANTGTDTNAQPAEPSMPVTTTPAVGGNLAPAAPVTQNVSTGPTYVTQNVTNVTQVQGASVAYVDSSIATLHDLMVEDIDSALGSIHHGSSGSGGGSGGTFDPDGLAITNSTFDNGTISNSTLVNTTFSGSLAVSELSVTGAATSTFAGGINITSGCVAVNGVCLGTGTSGPGTEFGGGVLTASYFVATTTIASQFPYASTTALTVSGTGYFGTASTTNLVISGAPGGILKTNANGVVTLAVAGTDYLPNNLGDWAGTFGGHSSSFYLDARNLANFGTPFYNSFHSTTTDALAEGTTNLYFTNARADARINATSTIGTLTSAPNLGTVKSTLTGMLKATSGVLAVATAGTDYEVPLAFTSPLVRTGGTISIPAANGSTNGYLSSADWNVFNAKFATTSTDFYLTTKTTDNLAQGTTNRYFSNALARSAVSASAGLTYDSGTGVFGLDTTGNWSGTFDGQEGSYYLANSFSTTSAAYFLAQNGGGSSFSTTSANYFFGTKTTDDLAQGTTNKYYSDALARAAISSTATGLSYNSGTGVIALTGGYSIPLTASTTEWSSFYANPSSRITAGTNLSWVGNTLNGPSDPHMLGLLSATAPLAYNSTTGVFSLATSSFSGPGSNLNADLLDGLDSTYFLANSFSTSSAAYFLAQNGGGASFSTTSANYFFGTKTTDDLAQGTTNKYFSNALARAAVSAGSGLAYDAGTGIFTLDTTGDWSGTFDGQEGSYYLDANNLMNFATPFNSLFAGKTTDDLAQGTTHLYYTDAQVGSYITSSTTLASFINYWTKTGANLSYNAGSVTAPTLGTTNFTLGSDVVTDLTGTGLTVSGGALGIDPSFNSFSTTSANYNFNTNFASKTTDNLAEGTTNKYFSNALVGAYISGSSTVPHVAGGAYGALLSWNGTAWASRATSTLGIALADTTGTLAMGQGGTGFATYTAGDILYADNSGTLQRLPVGATGTVLKVTAGLPAWGVDQTVGAGGAGDGIFATSTGLIYPIDTSSTLAIGTNATSTSNSVFEVTGQSYFSTKVGIATTSPGSLLSIGGVANFGTATSTFYSTGGINLANGGCFAIGGVCVGSNSVTSASYPLEINNQNISLAFGTTTANEWSQQQTFDADVVALADVLVGGQLTAATISDVGLTNDSLTYSNGAGQLDSVTLGNGLAFTGGHLSVDQGQAFSTTSADFWKTQRDFFSTTSAAYFLSINGGNSFSTTSANNWLTTKTTDNLAQGTTNKYYSDALARAAISTNATGLTYTAGSGVLSLTAGYAIPLAASTTEWSSFYSTPSSRITAGTNLAWAGNTLNGPSDTYIRGLVSALSPLAYNNATGVFSLATTSFSGSGSNLNADLLDGLDSTYFLANSFSTSSAAYFLSINGGNAFSTTSANNWLTTKTTDNLAQGTTNKYYSDALARAAISTTATGLTYNNATGVLALTGGYNIPLTASTTEWSSFYNAPSSRITAGTNLSWVGNTLNGPSDAHMLGLLSATAPLAYNSTTGVFSLATTSFSGSGSNLNADFLDGLDSTYFLANAFSTTSADFWKTQRDFFSTTSANYLFGTKTTDDLTQGTTNKYYSDALARAAVSAGTGLAYNSATGVFTLNATGDWTGTFDGQEGSYYLANSFSTTSASYFLAQNLGNAFSTTSSNYWLTTKTTDNLAEGLTNKYWSNTLFDNRLSATTSLPNITTLANLGTVKTSLTGVLKATSGVLSVATAGTDYQVPLAFSYPLVNTANTVSLAFGTTTANTWALLQNFTSGVNVSQYSGYYQNGALLGYASSTNGATIFGLRAGGQNATTSATATNITAVGYQALTGLTTGGQNTALGVSALKSDTTGSSNTGVGVSALSDLSTGSFNTAMGFQAAFGQTLGSDNVAIGRNAGYGNGGGFSYSASRDTVVGSTAGSALANGADDNAFFGYGAGSNVGSGFANILIGASPIFGNLTSGSGNIGLGNDTFFPSSASSNTLNIGGLVFGTLPATSTAFRLPTSGAIGIGSSSPFAKFSIQTNAGDTAGTLFAIGSSTASATTTLFTVSNAGTVYAGGLVGIGTTSPSQMLSVQGSGLFSGNLTSVNLAASGTGTFGNVIDSGLTANTIVYANGSKQLASGTVSGPLSLSSGTLSIAKATASTDGYLSAADWTTFNGKASLSSLSATYPVLYDGAGTFSLAFGTTTANSWSALQQFNGGASTTALSVAGDETIGGNSAITGALGVGMTNVDPGTIKSSNSIYAGNQFVGRSGDSETAPDYTWSGDLGTGFAHPAANTVILTTGGVERFRVDGSGNLGIGTTTPGSAISVEGDGLFDGTVIANNVTIGSLSGVLKATNGVISAGIAGTDYENPLTFSYPLTRTGNAIALAFGTTTTNTWAQVQNFTSGVNVSQYSGYYQNGALLGYASTTNGDTIFGLNAGGQDATTSNATAYNVAIGYQAMKANGFGAFNVANGALALSSNVTGGDNTAVGYNAVAANTSGQYNSGFGAAALGSNSTGSWNTSIGGLSMQFVNGGASYNTALGYQAGAGSFTGNSGSYNVALGYRTLAANTTGNNNTILGNQGGFNITTGSNNVLIGEATSSASLGQVTTGSGNVALGFDVAVPSPTANNQLSIGNLIYGTGLDGRGASVSSGNIGIGTTTPGSKLAVQGVANFGTATSTFYGTGGINLSAGCYAVNGVCLGAGSGTVTSVNASGGTTGLTFSGGPITTSGSLTLAGTLGVANGGTGSTTLSGLLKGNGTGALLSAVAGTDYLAPSSLSATYPILYSGNTFSLAFGTTTANSWSALQQFNGGASTTQLTTTGNTYLATAGGYVGVGNPASTSDSMYFTNTLRVAGTIGVRDDGGGVVVGSGNSDSHSTGAVLFGLNNSTFGTNGVTAVGSNSNVNGNYGIAMGYFSTASGDYDTAIGYDSVAFGTSSVAIGNAANAGSDYSVAIGSNNAAGGKADLSLGYNNTIAFGTNFSAAIGSNITNSISNSVMIGPSDASKLTILGSGNVGIGSTSPMAPLSVQSTASPQVRIAYNAANYADIGVDATGQVSIRSNSVTADINLYNRLRTNVNSATNAAEAAFVNPNTTNATTVRSLVALGVNDHFGDPHYSFLAANQNGDLGISTGNTTSVTYGTERFTILAGGNVGIGSTTPGSLLSIGSTNGINFSTATSTFNSTGGINLASGCFAMNGTCIGLGTGSGSVTSVNASGGTTGLSFSGGPVTTIGTFTLGGTLAVANGGTGSTTLGGLLKGNGTGALLSAVAGTDYQAPITLTTTGTSGAATLTGNVLNIPQYAGTTYTAAYPITLTGSAIGLAFGTTTANSWSSLQTFDGGINIGQYTGIYQNGRLLGYASSTNAATIFGIGAGGQNATTSATFANTTAVGNNALNALTTGGQNTALGSSAGLALTTGSYNTALGWSTILRNTTGSHNTAIGGQSQLGTFSGNTGSDNVSVGYQSLENLSSASFNTGIGNLALQFASTGTYNTSLGYKAGASITSGYGNTIIGSVPDTFIQISTGSNNIGIGTDAMFPSATGNNQLSIGNFIFGMMPATTSASTLQVPVSGTLGVGTTSPYAKLSIQTNNGDTATTLFAIGSSTASATTTLLSISNTGIFTSNALATSSFASGLDVAALNITGSATSTAANGINLASGCYAVNGVCLSSGGAGTVSSVDASGGTTGLSFSGGPVTSSGTLTLAGTLGVANGGTGSTTLSGLLKGNGTGAILTAVAGTDYQAPITFAYPLVNAANTVSLAFGTTTANTWSQLQNFNGGASTTDLTLSGSILFTGDDVVAGRDNSFVGSGSGRTLFGIANEMEDAIDSSAFGNSNYVRGEDSGAFGHLNNVQGDNAYALGSESLAIGDRTLGVGYDAYASGTVAMAIGSDSFTEGNGAVAIGAVASALGGQALALGYDAAASGVGSIAIGADSSADGIGSIAFGSGSEADADNAFAFGGSIINDVADSLQIGPSDTAKLTILGNGNVGIGSTTPNSMLSVTGSAAITGVTELYDNLLLRNNSDSSKYVSLEAGTENSGADSNLALSTTHGGTLSTNFKFGTDGSGDYDLIWAGGVTPGDSNYAIELNNNNTDNWFNAGSVIYFDIGDSAFPSIAARSGHVGVNYNYSANPSGTFNVRGGDTSTGVGFQLVDSDSDPLVTELNYGSVGIGTTSPYAKLSIQGNDDDNTAFTTLFAIGSSTGGVNTTLFSVSNTGSTTAANGFNITAGCYAINGVCIGAGGGSGVTTANYPLQITGSNIALAFGTTTANSWSALQNFNGAASSTQLTTTGSTYLATTGGNVGVGTTSPFAKLSITGTGTGTGQAFAVANSSNVNQFVVQDNGRVLFSDGSAAAPGISFLNEPTTGFERSGGNTIAVVIGGTDSFDFTPSKIRSANPKGFSLGGGASATTSPTLFPNTGSLTTGIGGDTGGLSFIVGGTSAEVIMSNGNVGIGTTTPFGLLSINPNGIGAEPAFVVGSSTKIGFEVGNNGTVGIGTHAGPSILTASNPANGTVATFSNDSSGSFVKGVVSITSTNSSSAGAVGLGSTISFDGENAANGIRNQAQINTIWTNATGGAEVSDLYFSTNGGNSTTEKLRITGAGNVGIGTTTPGSLLSLGSTNGINFSLATSTFNSTGGINLTSGCYAINGVCIGAGGGPAFSTTATGLTYNSGTGVLSMTGGYSIPLTASTTDWNTAYTNRITSATYPLSITSNVLSLAFGTTTANAWSSLQNFNGGASTTQLTVTGNTYFPGGIWNSAGSVGIGSTSPSALLSLSGTSGERIKTTSNIANAFAIENSTGTTTLQIDTLDTANGIFSVATSTGNTYFLVGSGGNVGIGTTSPTAQFSTTGTVRFSNFGAGTLSTDAAGNLTVSSDERLKNVDGALPEGLAQIEQLNPILYHWNAQSGLDQTTQYAGFSAQNVQSAIPEAVDTDPRGFLTLTDRPILAAAVNAIKELAGTTNSLSIASTTMSTRLGSLETAIIDQQAQNQQASALVSAQRIQAQNVSVSGTLDTDTLTATTTKSQTIIVPNKTQSFDFGSTTISVVPPSSTLASGGVDLYKLATYAIANTNQLSAKMNALSTRIDTVELRLDALEAGADATTTSTTTPSGPITLTLAGLNSIFSKVGIMFEDGIAHFKMIGFNDLLVEKDANGAQAAATSTIPVGQTEIVVTNPHAHASSQIFVTLTAPVDGSWYIKSKDEGSFTIDLANAQQSDVTFDYLIIQTEKVALAASPTPIVPPTPPSTPTTPETPAGDTGTTPGTTASSTDTVAPVITLFGDESATVPENGSWTDWGASASDDVDGDISSKIVVSGAVDVTLPADYAITYTVSDAAGNTAHVSRTVTVVASAGSGAGSGSDSGAAGDSDSSQGSATDSTDPAAPSDSAPAADPVTPPAPVVTDAPAPPAGG